MSNLNKAIAKMNPRQQAKFKKLFAANKEAQASVKSFGGSSSDKKSFAKLLEGPSKEDLSSYNAKAITTAAKKYGGLDNFQNQERPAELTGKEVPYTFKGETKPWTKDRVNGENTSGLTTPTDVSETNISSFKFGGCGEDEDPVACENRKLTQELSHVSSRAVNEVKNQKLEIGTFKDTIQQNADMWKNKTKLNSDNLIMQKQANDTAWAAVQDQFDQNQKDQKTALDALETEWIKMQAERDNLQREYYNEVKTVLGNKAGGEGAGLTSQLSGKGLSPAMIANATAGVDKKYQSLFADAKDNHLGALENLQTGYTKFYESMNKNRATLGDAAGDFADETFARSETFNQDLKDLKDTEVEGMYGPIEKWFKDVGEAQTVQGAKVAGKAEKAAQYESASPEIRRNILLDNIVKISSEFDMTKFDTSILEAAAAMPSFSKALMYIAKSGQSAASTGESSALGSYVNKYGANDLISTFTENATNPEVKGDDIIDTEGDSETKLDPLAKDENEEPETKDVNLDFENGNDSIETNADVIARNGREAMIGVPPTGIVYDNMNAAKNSFVKQLDGKFPKKIGGYSVDKILRGYGTKIHAGMSLDDFENIGDVFGGGNPKINNAIKYKYTSMLASDLISEWKALNHATEIGGVTQEQAQGKLDEIASSIRNVKTLGKSAALAYADAMYSDYTSKLGL